jgi:hypothetical protein
MFELMCNRDIATLAVASTKWNSLEFQLDLKALMINRLEKPAALISINGKARPENRVAFIFVNQFYLFLFSCHWCVSWAKTLSC